MTYSCVPNKRGGWNTRVDGDFFEKFNNGVVPSKRVDRFFFAYLII